MSTKTAVEALPEYVSVSIAELVESSTNPRKAFDEQQLEELAESIRSKGILSPLLVRRENGHFEIVTGARRYRAAQRAGLREVPVRVATLTDEEALETQIVENLLRSDIHPFEEARGFRALLDRAGVVSTIERLAAKTGKNPSYISKRLRLLDLVPAAADAFAAGHIGIEHALLIAKIMPEVQEEALRHCFDGYYADDDKERSLVPVSRLQAWIEHNVYLSLKSAPFSKDDETLVPDVGSCANCPKRTGFNTLLFSEVREDSCADAACFNRKLDAHVAQRVAKMPNLVQISHNYQATNDTPVLPRRDYVEVVTRKTSKSKSALPEHKLCSHLTPAIHTDGMEKGRLVKICANPDCKVHFAHRKEEEAERLRWKAERKAENRKAKRNLNLRHRTLAEVLKRVKPPFGNEELRIVARFILRSLSHDLACRLAKRHGLQTAKKNQDWELAEKARSLFKTTDGAALAALIFEAMLLAPAGSAPETKDDPLADAAKLFKVDGKAVRNAVIKSEKEKQQKQKAAKPREGKAANKPKAAR